MPGNYSVTAFRDLEPAQKIERWEQVLRVLEGLSPHEREKHFDMSTWLNKTDCGTTGCVAGHCGMDPWFRERGFTCDLIFDEEGYPDVEMPVQPFLFFGHEGSNRVFTSIFVKTYDDALAATRGYLEDLREGKGDGVTIRDNIWVGAPTDRI